jgi:hypothetical protein
VLDSAIPSSTLKCKQNAICYHPVHQAVAAGMIRIAKVDSKQNLVGMLMKPLAATLLREFITHILY